MANHIWKYNPPSYKIIALRRPVKRCVKDYPDDDVHTHEIIPSNLTLSSTTHEYQSSIAVPSPPQRAAGISALLHIKARISCNI